MKCSLKFFLNKKLNFGVLISRDSVISLLLVVDAIYRTCLIPSGVTIFDGFDSVETTDSSVLKMLDSSKS